MVILTSISGQATSPRDLDEKLVWDEVVANPKAGKHIYSADGDPRFKQADGWKKMTKIHTRPDGSNIEIHYQYHVNMDKAYDIKITSPQKETVD